MCEGKRHIPGWKAEIAITIITTTIAQARLAFILFLCAGHSAKIFTSFHILFIPYHNSLH